MLNQFVNTGVDSATVNDMKKSIAREEDLQKAMNRAGLVQKEVQVQGKNGTTFTRKQWVKASDVSNNSKVDKLSSYEGKTDSEMRAIFDGKTAADVQDEKARIFESLGRPGNGNPKRKEFERATAPLGRLIGDTINNGTGDSSKDYDTLLKTSRVKASDADKNNKNSSAQFSQVTQSTTTKTPKIFTEDGKTSVSGGGYTAAGGRSQLMIHRSSAKQYIMLQCTKKDGSWGKPIKVELFYKESPEEALKRMSTLNSKQKWRFDPDSMEENDSNNSNISSTKKPESAKGFDLTSDKKSISNKKSTAKKDMSQMSESELLDRMKEVLAMYNKPEYQKQQDELFKENMDLMQELGKRQNKSNSDNKSNKNSGDVDRSSSEFDELFKNGISKDSKKQALKSLLKNGHTREDIMSQAQKVGITWKHNDNPGINWMRASMAITGATTRGNKTM